MQIPQTIHDAVAKAEARHPDDMEAAKARAIKAVRALPEFDAFRDALIDEAIKDLLYDKRHSRSTQIKRDAGCYGGPAKVDVGSSAAVARVAESVYQYRIGHSTLGNLTGADLDRFASSEDELAAGHQFNAALLRWCRAQGVADDQRVADCPKITEKKLRAQFKKLGRGDQGMAA